MEQTEINHEMHLSARFSADSLCIDSSFHDFLYKFDSLSPVIIIIRYLITSLQNSSFLSQNVFSPCTSNKTLYCTLSANHLPTCELFIFLYVVANYVFFFFTSFVFASFFLVLCCCILTESAIFGNDRHFKIRSCCH